MDGFIIKCNKCGKELEFKERFADYTDDGIYIGCDPITESCHIQCECGNEVNEF